MLLYGKQLLEAPEQLSVLETLRGKEGIEAFERHRNGADYLGIGTYDGGLIAFCKRDDKTVRGFDILKDPDSLRIIAYAKNRRPVLAGEQGYNIRMFANHQNQRFEATPRYNSIGLPTFYFFAPEQATFFPDTVEDTNSVLKVYNFMEDTVYPDRTHIIKTFKNVLS